MKASHRIADTTGRWYGTRCDPGHDTSHLVHDILAGEGERREIINCLDNFPDTQDVVGVARK